MLTALVSQTVLQVMAAQTPSSTQADQPCSRERIDERHYRKMGAFSGTNWKDWSFQFRSSTKSSSVDAYKLVTERLSGQLFNLITTMTSGEPLQLLHNCNYNGAEAWRQLAKRYSPSSPLRAMQLMMQVIAPEKAKSVTDIRTIIEKWESRVLMLQRDFEEKVSSKMKTAILISILPTD